MTDAASVWVRRARPLLGTFIELGVAAGGPDTEHAEHTEHTEHALRAGFAAIIVVQACLSRFEEDSDIARFHALRAGASMTLREPGHAVLGAAQQLRDASAGLFDISLGSAPFGWRVEGERLHKLDAAARLDLGGIAKGHAVDCAVQALQAHGCAAGWVNAGGDLRAFGGADVPVFLRDETRGGCAPFARLGDGAFATSHFAPGSRSHLAGVAGAGADSSAGSGSRRGCRSTPAHASVAAPLCLWADALTKLVARSRDPRHPLLRHYDALAWLH
jgi:thiamine biosynthesis lipoprotein